ncbi:KUP/HAK/KT family potassium transporter [Hydrocarboniphaga sp.]|uniref:KUP/HAK/KT family potassium transporter n=1 Tax=Hydrocarboniphaga sp. TaxID=2033016 RepID=UPI00262E6878|nr:KUP/HAK/KT family potassium transporter [Hydrocarboniphaga sp.]
MNRRSQLVLANSAEPGTGLQAYIDGLPSQRITRVQGTAVFLVATPDRVPQSLISNLRHNRVLHERNIILHLAFHQTPWVGMSGRTHIEQLGNGFWRVTLNFGFMNVPDVPKALRLCSNRQGLQFGDEAGELTYFLSRLTAVPTPGRGMALWRERLFAAMSNRSSNAAEFFCLPDDAVVLLSTRVPI